MRNALDAYFTPEWQVKALLNRMGNLIFGSLFECCVGDGSISRLLPRTQMHGEPNQIYTNDIDPNRKADFHFDATDYAAWASLDMQLEREGKAEIDWTISNPPFSTALPILQNSFRHSRLGVIMLLRITFLEPTELRSPILHESPPDKIIVLPRWSYKRNGGSDSATTAWMIWTEDTVGKPIEVVTKEEQRTLMAQ